MSVKKFLGGVNKSSLVGLYGIEYRYRNSEGEHLSEIRNKNLEELKYMFKNMHIYGRLVNYRILKYIKYYKEDGSLGIEIIEEKRFEG